MVPAYSYAWHLFAARHGVLAADCGALDSVTDTVPLDLTRFMPPHLLDEVCWVACNSLVRVYGVVAMC